jgi:hypothetical protein
VGFCYWFKRTFCLRSYAATHVFCFFGREIAGSDAVEYPVVFVVSHGFAFHCDLSCRKLSDVVVQARVSIAGVGGGHGTADVCVGPAGGASDLLDFFRRQFARADSYQYSLIVIRHVVLLF